MLKQIWLPAPAYKMYPLFLVTAGLIAALLEVSLLAMPLLLSGVLVQFRRCL